MLYVVSILFVHLSCYQCYVVLCIMFYLQLCFCDVKVCCIRIPKCQCPKVSACLQCCVYGCFCVSFVRCVMQYISESKGKVLRVKKEEEKVEMPVLKKASRVSKVKEEDKDMIGLKKVLKTQVEEHEESQKVYAEAKTQVIITESYEAEIHLESYETIKRVEKMPPEVGKKKPIEPAQEPQQVKPESEADEKTKKKIAAKVPKEDIPEEPSLALKKVKKLPLETKDEESVKLKPFVIPPQTEEPEKVQLKPFAKKPSAESPPEKVIKIPKAKIEKEPSTPQKKDDTQETPVEVKEGEKMPTIKPTDDKKVLPKKITPVKTEVTPKEDEKKPIVPQKGILPKETEEKEEITLKPIEHAKKDLEPKKIPSPKVEKTKPIETVSVEKKPSKDLAKKPKTVSPKVSLEAVTLKKVPKKVSPKEDKAKETPKISEAEKVPVMKELFSGAVELTKVPTQPEEEVFEEEAEAEAEFEAQDEDEAWAWEVASRDSYGSEGSEYLEEGALETPGMPGGRRGERVAIDYINE